MSKKQFVIFFTVAAVFILAVFISPTAVTVFNNTDEYVNLPVLMYHSVIKDPSKTGKYVITPEKFEEDLLYLKQKGYTSISANQLIRHVYAGEELPDKPIVITFDDGMYNNSEYIVPILEKHDAHAVFSVVGSYVDEYSKSGIVNPNYSYLRWEDIVSLSENEHVEFGNHSYSFHSISDARYGTQKNQYESALDYISVFYRDTQKMQSEFLSHCGYRPVIYTYPFGSYSKESERVLKKNGFFITFSCVEGINKITQSPDCLYMLKRYNRDGRLSSWEFFGKIKGL